jgi:hypothetical protein
LRLFTKLNEKQMPSSREFVGVTLVIFVLTLAYVYVELDKDESQSFVSYFATLKNSFEKKKAKQDGSGEETLK